MQLQNKTDLERVSLEKSRPNEAPIDFPRTMILSHQGDFTKIVSLAREVWRVVNSWGLWFEDYNGAPFPELESIRRQLPRWFSEWLDIRHKYALSSFVQSVEPRNWIVWSFYGDEKLLKVDLESYAFPIDYNALTLLFEALGGKLITCEDWIDLEEMGRRY